MSPIAPVPNNRLFSSGFSKVDAPAAMWNRIDEIVAEIPDVVTLRRHRLHLLAAHRLREAGLPLSPELLGAERLHAMKMMSTRYVLNRIRAAVDGRLVLMKGVEVAASYAIPECRPYRDLDILTPDPQAAHRALRGAGFVEVEDFGATEFHLRPVALPGVPLIIELHRGVPHYALGLPVPSTETLLELTQPSRTGVAGFEGMMPSAHAVLLAVHAWAHGPLERIGQLIDVAAVLADGDTASADRIARSWGCGRLWRTTLAAVGAVLGQEREPLAVRVWARHLRTAREPRVLESYLSRLMAPAWGMPPGRIARGVWEELCRTALPDEHETWGDQLTHLVRALGRAGQPLSHFRV